MIYITIHTSKQLNEKVRTHCFQVLPFYIGATKNPLGVSVRLNNGWKQNTDPRAGETSQPLIKENGWKEQHRWIIDKRVDFEDPDFCALFEKPCIVASIKEQLRADDKRDNPNKQWASFLFNGINQVFCLKRSDSCKACKGADISLNCGQLGDCDDDEIAVLHDVQRAIIESYFKSKNIEFTYVL